MAKFSNAVEQRYQDRRQLFLARQDLSTCRFFIGLVALWSAAASLHPVEGAPAFLVARSVAALVLAACCYSVPLALGTVPGMAWYTRRRPRIMLCLRLALVCASATGGKHLATLRLTPSDAPSSCLRALGQLLLSARFFSLLMIPLGLQLGAGETAALQAAGVVAFWWCLSSECRCCFLAHPATQRCFTRVAHWLGHGPSPLPLPPADMPPCVDPCLALGGWIQFFWLGVLPCLLVAAREANARKEFALALPRGMLPAAERSAWAAAVVPSSWLITLLFMPAVSLLAWRIAAPMAPCGDAAE